MMKMMKKIQMMRQADEMMMEEVSRVRKRKKKGR